MSGDQYDLRTPEQIDLQYDLAGLGSRSLAMLVDASIQGVVILALVLVFGLGMGLMGGTVRRRISFRMPYCDGLAHRRELLRGVPHVVAYSNRRDSPSPNQPCSRAVRGRVGHDSPLSRTGEGLGEGATRAGYFQGSELASAA